GGARRGRGYVRGVGGQVERDRRFRGAGGEQRQEDGGRYGGQEGGEASPGSVSHCPPASRPPIVEGRDGGVTEGPGCRHRRYHPRRPRVGDASHSDAGGEWDLALRPDQLPSNPRSWRALLRSAFLWLSVALS